MKKLAIASTAVFSFLMGANSALGKSPIAEVLCEPTPRLYDKLSTQMGGQKTATGIRSPEQIMEVWTDAKGRWTMVVTYATGTSCIVAMGDDWWVTDADGPA